NRGLRFFSHLNIIANKRKSLWHERGYHLTIPDCDRDSWMGMDVAKLTDEVTNEAADYKVMEIER
ncbi:MAG: hypothetical protein Q4D60_11650, partial [Eubacteriales bacterium]|nr:hypothetical protein [Eubacteriales bacterium]